MYIVAVTRLVYVDVEIIIDLCFQMLIFIILISYEFVCVLIFIEHVLVCTKMCSNTIISVSLAIYNPLKKLRYPYSKFIVFIKKNENGFPM